MAVAGNAGCRAYKERAGHCHRWGCPALGGSKADATDVVEAGGNIRCRKWLICWGVRIFDPEWPRPQPASPRIVALAYLAVLTQREQRLDAERDQAVADAVAAGADWGQIGQATGRTRQGARQRWSRRLPPPRAVAHDDLVPDEIIDAPADRVPPGPHPMPELPEAPALAAWIVTQKIWHEPPPEDPWATY